MMLNINIIGVNSLRLGCLHIVSQYEFNHTLHSRSTIYHYSRHQMINPSAAVISAYYSWDMGLLHGDVHLSELERLDKPCATMGHDLYSTILATQLSHHHHFVTSLQV